MRFLSLILFLGLFMTACGNSTETSQDGKEFTETEEQPTTEMAAELSITPMPDSKDYPDAAIRGLAFQNGIFDYTLSEGEYKLGLQTPDAGSLMCANSVKGQHIHLIVDNEPYAAKYEPNFEYKIEDGEHYILTFLSRSYHESLKHAGAARAIKVNVKGGAFASQSDIKDPMLFYSRPKGTYTGPNDTKNIMLDFYPVNARLGADYKVKVEVNGSELIVLDEWRPYYLKGLPMGENTITLTLIDAAGKTVKAPLNPVSRTFTLDPGPTVE